METISYKTPPGRFCGLCPYCGTKVSFRDQHRFDTVDYSFVILVCPDCDNSTIIKVSKGGNFVVEVIPDPKPQPIPGEIENEELKKDYHEALLCFSAGAHTATVIMCRRAIQRSVKSKGAKGKTLYDQIEYMIKKEGLAPVLAKAAHQIRGLGNKGAHPEELGDVSPEEAEKALEYLEWYIKDVYILPKSLEKFDEKSEDREKDETTSSPPASS